MLRLSYAALVSGVVLSFHDTLYPWAIVFVVAWATLASISNWRESA
jgi:hypothetical protein